jgi:drug/metabolite transporter, DME family
VRRREGASLSALLVVAGTALFGTVGTARVLGPDIPATIIAAARLGSSALLFAALGLLLGHAAAMARTVRLPWAYLAGAGQAGFQVCFLFAVEEVGVALGTLVAIGCTPLLAGLMTRQVTRAWGVATAVSVPGLALLVGADPGDAGPLGLAGALGAALSYATYIVASRHLVAGGAAGMGTLATIFSLSALALAPFLVLGDPGDLWTGPGLVTVAYLAVVPTVLAYHLFNAGLRGVPASTAATLGLTEPVVAAALGVLVLREPLTATGALGAALVLAGLFVLVTRQRAEQ